MGRAVRELADPLLHPTTQAWLEAAGEAVREVVGAADVTVFGPDNSQTPSTSSHPPEVVEAFRAHVDVLEEAGCRTRALAAGVATRRQIFGPAFETLAATPYVREFLPSIGAHDSLTVATEAGGEAVRVVLNVDDTARPFGPEHVAVGRLLQPALAAGFLTDRALGAARADLVALVDAAGTRCVVFDERGHRLHLSAALDDRLAREPRRDDLLALADGLAGQPSRTAAFDGVRGRYTLSASRAWLDGRPTSVVAVVPPSDARLTPRQADVAALLAQRYTNREIAALGHAE